jgi:hypothetical protein
LLLARYISEAVIEGARLKKACNLVGISVQSFSRWRSGKVHDYRKGAVKTAPRKLSQEERDEFYKVANSPDFRDLTSPQIVATLLEQGSYFGCPSTLYRIFREKEAL